MQVAEDFARAHWCGRPIQVLTPADSVAITALEGKIKDMAPTFDFSKSLTGKDVDEHEELSKYMQRHCRRSKYMFQWMRSPPAELPSLPLADALPGTGTSTSSEQDGTSLWSVDVIDSEASHGMTI